MGSNLAQELAGGEFNISLEQQIAVQLRNNHYPPVPLSMVQPCIEAINACNDGNSGELIDLPDGISWRGEPTAPAYAIVEGHRLEPWIDYED